jgi:hypothetical protein
LHSAPAPGHIEAMTIVTDKRSEFPYKRHHQPIQCFSNLAHSQHLQALGKSPKIDENFFPAFASSYGVILEPLLAAMLYIPGGLIALLGNPRIPAPIIPFHGLEILADSIVYGFVLSRIKASQSGFLTSRRKTDFRRAVLACAPHWTLPSQSGTAFIQSGTFLVHTTSSTLGNADCPQ